MTKFKNDEPVQKCAICGNDFQGWGNNPEPVVNTVENPEARCCGECDQRVVIPTRINMVLGNRISDIMGHFK